METEIWKPIKGYEGLYEISNLGKFRNAKTKLIKNTRASSTCTAKVVLWKYSNYENAVLGKLILEAFSEIELPKKYTLVFKNSDKSDLHLANLLYVTSNNCVTCNKNFDASTQNINLIECPVCRNRTKGKIKYRKNPECNIVRSKKWRNKNTTRVREFRKAWAEKERINLGDTYIRKCLTSKQNRFYVDVTQVTPEMIELKRNIIKIKRICKQ